MEPRTPRVHLLGLRRGRAGDRGASLVEYALLVALIFMACLGGLSLLGMTNGGSINRSASSVVEATN